MIFRSNRWCSSNWYIPLPVFSCSNLRNFFLIVWSSTCCQSSRVWEQKQIFERGGSWTFFERNWCRGRSWKLLEEKAKPKRPFTWHASSWCQSCSLLDLNLVSVLTKKLWYKQNELTDGFGCEKHPSEASVRKRHRTISTAVHRLSWILVTLAGLAVNSGQH